MMPSPDSDPWEEMWVRIASFSKDLSTSKAINVNSDALRSKARELVQYYFRYSKPELDALAMPETYTDSLSDAMQNLLRLSNGRNAKSSYSSILKRATDTRVDIEVQRDKLIGEGLLASRSIEVPRSSTERLILNTLSDMGSPAFLSYEQAILDLDEESRVSYRGTAAELREVLREVLDQLAPDKDVSGAPGFTLETDRSKPTMKQKVKFILKSRGIPTGARGAPENTTKLVDDLTASVARSTYTKGSVAAHTPSTRGEVLQLKGYLDSVLTELLQIHS